MKKIIATVVFVCAIALVKAQYKFTSPRAFSYQQKRWLDSLRNAHKQPAVAIHPQPLPVCNTPVSGTKNESEKIGLTGEDTFYRMKTDNMLLLKPDNSTTAIPNATDGKLFIVPPTKEKP